ncbi:hypothetical protein B0H11DRAFT_1978770 [Mycena galericulata]|nr:hypothetical protein B0H11DRAFT_1978770 [Mycena galericulata]
MLLCRRILFQLEFGTFRGFASTHIAIPSVAFTRSSPSTLHPNDTEGSDKMKGKISDLQGYKHLRALDRPSLAALPVSSYLRLLNQASRLELVGMISQLIEDMLELCPESQRASAVLSIMSSATFRLVPLGKILLMLQCLHGSPSDLEQLPAQAVAVLVRTVATAAPHPADTSLVDLVYPLLLNGLQILAKPEGHAVLTYKPPEIIHASFAFVDKLIKLSQEERALNIFQILVNSGNIPSEAVQTIPGLNDFASIVRSSLVRASTHWHWQPLAETFLSSLLNSSPTPIPPTIALAVDTIYACLGRPTVADLRAARLLILQVHPFSPLPNGIIRQFYAVAEELGEGPEAHALYAFTRSAEVMETHQYPCPRGSSLPWLLRYLSKINSHYAKDLGQEVLEGNLLIPVESRTHIVSALASRGHGVLARGLWSRYAVGKDREAFIRNSSLMIRMVSLFHHLAKRGENTLAGRAGKGPFVDDELIRQQTEDYKGFLDFVLSEYDRAHSPISRAHHRILTSQARAFFIIGQFVRGFDTLKILLKRQEMPDLYDVNVTLTVMAEHDPRTAAKMVQRMIKKGLQPDHITFGTVMHHALTHGDMELVDEMVNHVRALKTTQLSYKSIVSLVRGSVAFDSESDFTHRAKLQSVFNIIKSVGRSTVVTSPHIGKYLVFAALRSDDPVMAFKFWEFLLKDNAPWY